MSSELDNKENYEKFMLYYQLLQNFLCYLVDVRSRIALSEYNIHEFIST